MIQNLLPVAAGAVLGYLGYERLYKPWAAKRQLAKAAAVAPATSGYFTGQYCPSLEYGNPYGVVAPILYGAPNVVAPYGYGGYGALPPGGMVAEYSTPH